MTETASESLAKEFRECLVRLPEDRTRWTRRACELLTEGGQTAVQESIEFFRGRLLPTDSEKALLAALLERGYLLPVLQVIHETDRLRFREVLSLAQAVEPRLHTRAGKRLAELLAGENLDRVSEIVCLFDSLVQMSGMANLSGALTALSRVREPRLRARAALLAAALPNGRHLLELYREEADPRVRVNILKALWLDDQPIARVVFEEARRDVQPRVRAYGLLGLYRLGDQRSLAALAELAESPQAITRAVARTAMELLGDPRFQLLQEKLNKEFGESTLKCEPVSPATRTGSRRLQLSIPRIQRLASGALRLQVSARLDNGEHLDPVLRPLDVRAWVDGQPVWNYTVNRVTPARRIGLGMVLPLTLRAASETTPGIRGILDILLAMPEAELRSACFYRSGLFMRQMEQDQGTGASVAADAASRATRLPVVSQDAFRFAADLKEASKEENLAQEPGDLALGMLGRLKVLKPVGHIGVVLNTAVKCPPNPLTAESIGQGCRENGVALHLLAVGQVREDILAPWQVVCRRSGGFQSRIPTEEELPDVLDRWMLCFRESYSVEFDAPASAAQIRVQAVHPLGFGEATAMLATD